MNLQKESLTIDNNKYQTLIIFISSIALTKWIINTSLQSLVGCRWSLFRISLVPLQTWQLPRRSTPPSHPCRELGRLLGPVHSVHWTGHNYDDAVCPLHETIAKGHRKEVIIYDFSHNQVLQGECVCVCVQHTSVISREAAAALMCKLGCLTELLQSNARAKVPTALQK